MIRMFLGGGVVFVSQTNHTCHNVGVWYCHIVFIVQLWNSEIVHQVAFTNMHLAQEHVRTSRYKEHVHICPTWLLVVPNGTHCTQCNIVFLILKLRIVLVTPSLSPRVLGGWFEIWGVKKGRFCLGYDEIAIIDTIFDRIGARACRKLVRIIGCMLFHERTCTPSRTNWLLGLNAGATAV